jgi:hypothetical protein
MFYTKNDPHDARDFLKPLRIEHEGHFNPAVRCLSMSDTSRVGVNSAKQSRRRSAELSG